MVPTEDASIQKIVEKLKVFEFEYREIEVVFKRYSLVSHFLNEL